MSRLYPGFGSGKGTFEGVFAVSSFGSVGRGDMEAGDKIFLPPSAFKDISRMKLPFPLMFKVSPDTCVCCCVCTASLRGRPYARISGSPSPALCPTSLPAPSQSQGPRSRARGQGRPARVRAVRGRL